MPSQTDARLDHLGIVLPTAAAPAANYVPYVVSGHLVFISGQLPMRDGQLQCQGKLGAKISLEDGRAAARLVGLNILAQVKAACGGNLDRVRRCVKLGGFVNSTPEFTEQAKVINGASDLMVEVLEERGRHARAAVSAPALPFDAAVEIEAIFEIA